MQAGAFAAFTVDLLVYPLDTLKTRLQSQDYEKIYKDANGATKRSLFRGLYQGVGSVILITIPSSGAFFTTYEALKYGISEAFPPNSTIYLPQPAIHAAASGGAELVSCAILTPAEVLKQNAQMLSSGKRGSTSLEVFKQFRKQPTKLWRGYTALAARNLPFTGLQFPAFESLKEYFMQKRVAQNGGRPVDGILERGGITALSAGIAGSAAAWITTPIDVVKTRIMLAAGSGDDNPKTTEAKSKTSNFLLHGAQGSRKSGFIVAREILKTHGVRGLFRGALLRACWTSLGSGLYLGCYESGRFYLEKSRSTVREGDHLMQRDWSEVQVGIGRSRSQDVVKKSAWQDD